MKLLFRRVCVLRSAGEDHEANRLCAEELPRAVEAARCSAVLGDAEIETLFAAEEERVANAQVLAQILLPLLLKSSAATLAVKAAPETGSLASALSPPARHVEKPPAAAIPGIADFIDEMLSQDRPVAPSHRDRRSA